MMMAARRRRLTRISPAHDSIRRAASQLASSSGRWMFSMVSFMADRFRWTLDVRCWMLDVLPLAPVLRGKGRGEGSAHQAPRAFDQSQQTRHLNRTDRSKIHVPWLDELHEKSKPQIPAHEPHKQLP